MTTGNDDVENQIEAQQARILNAKAAKSDLLDQLKEQDRVIAESMAIITGIMYAKSIGKKDDAGKE